MLVAGIAAARRQGQPVPASSDCWEAGAVVAVCGLHGGAGTTSCALALATAIAERCGRAVLVEADPCGGALAARLGYGSPSSLADVVDALLDPRGERVAELVATDAGVELVAGDCRSAQALDGALVTGALVALARQTGTCVVDCGTVRGAHAPCALAASSVVLWCTRAARASEGAVLLSGPLARHARHARWILATCAGRAPRGALAALREDLDARIVLPDDDSDAAGQVLVDAVGGLVA